MMKKVLSLTLVLALCLGLTVPALAADYGVDVVGVDSSDMELDNTVLTFQVWEGWDDSFDNPQDGIYTTLTLGTPHPFDTGCLYALPLGQTISFNYPTTYSVVFYAFTDTGDGIYRQRLFSINADFEIELLPASLTGPITSYLDAHVGSDGKMYYSHLPCVSYSSDGTGSGMLEMGWSSSEGKMTVTSDFLTDYFGPNTLLQIQVTTYTGADSWYYNILTGKQADSAPTAGFKDVPADAYYADAVVWAVEQGIVKGTGKATFSPDSSCTRGQIVTMLHRLYGSPEPKTAVNPFKDVKENDYYYKAVLWAVENGIASGTGKAAFSPNQTCTRAQAAAFLWKAAGKPASSGSNSFKDVPTGAYYADAVAWAAENKIITGTSKTAFSPNNNCTRGQIVTLFYRGQGKM